MAFQNLILPIVSVFRSVGIQAARGALGGLNKDFETFAKEAGKAGLAFAGLQALMASTQFINESVNLTQQYERNMLALKQVFTDFTPQMATFTKEVADYGIGQAQAAQASVFLGSVLKQYGLEQDQVTEKTQTLVKLSQDLATTYGYDLSEALLAMTALFRGEYDPIEKFGVAMKQSEINAALAAKGLDNLEGSELMLAQVQERLGLLFQRSADASGAYTRASDTLYVSQQNLAAAFQNLQVAFGEPLQKPLSEVTDAFAKIARDHGPGVANIGAAIGDAIEAATPMIVFFSDAFVSLLEVAITPAIEGFTLVLDLMNNIVGVVPKFVEAVQAIGADFEGPQLSTKDIPDQIVKLQALTQEQQKLQSLIEQGGLGYQAYEKQLAAVNKRIDEVTYSLDEQGTEAKRDEARIDALTARYGLNKEAADEVAKATSFYGVELQNLSLYTTDAEGKLTGLAAVFGYIGEEAEKSKATEQLEMMGFNASQIEYFLTQPDWAAIFGQISRLAKIAAIDIAGIGDELTFSAQYAAAVAQGEAIAALEKLKSQVFTGGGGGGTTKAKPPKDVVKDLFTEMQDEIQKQTARIKLAAMGASEGLIDLILGKDDWMKLWQQIKQGTISLTKLQEQFNKTAAGAAELQDALDAAAEEAQKYIDTLQEEADRLYDVWQEAKVRAEEFKKSIADIANLDILPTIDQELGRFEQQIVSTFQNIREELERGLEAGTLYEADYRALLNYANQEAMVLASIARQRDDLANRYSLSEALIAEYTSAFSSSASLTSLFGQLKNETEKRTVTEVTQGIVELSSSLKEFNVTVTREYEETIDTVINKSEGLLDGFRSMAEKARSFADNLRKLQDMGLDPQLFNQLVQAGVEAGGETAQALVDGGSDTITEINSLFGEINALGADLGEEVAATLYGTGIDMANGLLEGIRSKQAELENLAVSMAQAFNDSFAAKVSIAVQAPVAAAEKAYQEAAAAVPKIEDIDLAGLAQLDAFIKNAEKSLDVITNPTTAAGVLFKQDLAEQLYQDVLSGAKLDLSGITSGLSSEAFLEAAKSTGSTTINNTYNVSVDGGASKADAYSTGQAYASGLATFNSANGNVSAAIYGA
jgi:predicted  nucleic acid-binding Zn-ribbon protein